MPTAVSVAPSATPALPPLRIEPHDAFGVVHALFTSAPFDERAVAARLGISSMVELSERTPYVPLDEATADATELLIRLFVDRAEHPRALAARLFGVEGVRALEDVGLLVGDPVDGTARGDAVRATVMVHPVDDVWIASDWVSGAMIVSGALASDHVFSASNNLTKRYLDFVPDAPGGRFLELCSATGIAAIRAVVRGAAEAWATDVVPRCLHFMRFNALLNGVGARVTVLASDVWAALDGETFDVIAAHPPYVPALDHQYDYRDGGGDGEQITRRIFEGLAPHLRPGGRCVVRAGLTERSDAPIAQRVRGWLDASDAGRALDVAALEDGVYGAVEAYRATQRQRGYRGIERWLEHFDALGIRHFALCTVEARRSASADDTSEHTPPAPRAPLTARASAGPVSDGRTLDWQFRWARYVATGPDAESRLRDERPRVSPDVRVTVQLQIDAQGDWHTVGATAETVWPSHGVVKLPPLAPTMLELYDGTRGVADVLAGLRGAELVDADVTTAHVAAITEKLAEAGVLTLARCPPPPRDAT